MLGHDADGLELCFKVSKTHLQVDDNLKNADAAKLAVTLRAAMLAWRRGLDEEARRAAAQGLNSPRRRPSQSDSGFLM